MTTPTPAAVVPRRRLHRAELLQQHLRGEVVALVIHVVDERGERRRVDGGERNGLRAGSASTAPPAIRTPTRTSALRKSCAADSAGFRDVHDPTRPRLTISADSGGDSST